MAGGASFWSSESGIQNLPTLVDGVCEDKFSSGIRVTQ